MSSTATRLPLEQAIAMAPSAVRLVSYGGGVQSTALLVLAAQRKIDYRTFLFCNVGEDSEAPETLDYVREVAWPYAERHGIEMVELQKIKRDGTIDTVLRRINESKRSVPIPVRMARNGAPGTRQCTFDFKIWRVARELKARGATAEQPAMVALGISTDEFKRARTESGIAWETLDYPLLTLRLSRYDCERIVAAAGLPVPPKSACWFCPLRRASGWARMKLDDPERFERVVQIEGFLPERRLSLGKDPVYFHSKLKPLPMATTDGYQLGLDLDDDDGGCESGFCWT
jgi:hypothetical protein